MNFANILKKWRWLTLFFLVLLSIGAIRTYFRLTDDFRLANITYDIPYHPEWNIELLDLSEKQKLDSILSQTFSYLGKGAQSYVFSSDDQQYVIKFLKFKHLKPSLLASALPNVWPFKSYLEAVSKRKQKKFDSIFNGYRLAYRLHRGESGLMFIQLNPSGKNRVIVLKDKIGLKRSLDLGTVPYIIQKKGQTLRQVLTELLDEKNTEAAKERISQIFALYMGEYRKGIYDRDHGVLHNVGFADKKALHLDVGKLSYNEETKNPEFYRKDIRKVADRMIPWIAETYPSMSKELILHIENCVQNFH